MHIIQMFSADSRRFISLVNSAAYLCHDVTVLFFNVLLVHDIRDLFCSIGVDYRILEQPGSAIRISHLTFRFDMIYAKLLSVF